MPVHGPGEKMRFIERLRSLAFVTLAVDIADGFSGAFSSLLTGREPPKRDRTGLKVTMAVGFILFFDSIFRKTKRVHIKAVTLEPRLDLSTQELGLAARIRF